MTKKKNWIWYGYAGHLVVSRRCAYHLCTDVGGYLVSTVGALYPHDKEMMERIGSGPDDYFETMVFRCDGQNSDGDPNILSWEEVELKRYASSLEAEKGHHKFCKRYARMKKT